MESIKKLMLRIEGGETNEPLKTLLNVGDVPDNMRLAPSLISLDQSWRIVHAQMFTAYGLWSPATTSRGTKGHLQITLFVPPMQQLSNSVNPLDVLNAVIDLMGVKDTNGLRLPDMPLDTIAFERLLKKYNLEERPMPLPVMAGKAPGTFCVSNEKQLRALMRFSRYPALAKVSQLEMGYNCSTTVDINTKGGPKKSDKGGNKPSPQAGTPPPLDGTPPPLNEESQPPANGLMGGRSLDTPEQVSQQDDPLFNMGINSGSNQSAAGGDKQPADTTRRTSGSKPKKVAPPTPVGEKTPPTPPPPSNGFMGGRSLDDDSSSYDNNPFDTEDNNEEKPKKKWWKIPLIILGVIVLLFVLLIILSHLIPNPEPSPTSNIASETSSTEQVSSIEQTSEGSKPAEAPEDMAKEVKTDPKEIRNTDQQKKEEEERLLAENKKLKEEKKIKEEQIEKTKQQIAQELLKQGRLQEIISRGLATPEQERWIREIIRAEVEADNPKIRHLVWHRSYDNWNQVEKTYHIIRYEYESLRRGGTRVM